jgi:Protein of unknown function (DUF3592)
LDNSIDWKNLVGIFLLIPALITLGMDIGWINSVIEARHTATWPTVEGVIYASTAEYGARNQFNSNIRYSYKYANQVYRSTVVALGPGAEFSSRSEAEEMVGRYPLGKVKVWVNPQRPEDSVLLSGAVLPSTWKSIEQFAVFGIFALITSIYLFVLARRDSAAGSGTPSVS